MHRENLAPAEGVVQPKMNPLLHQPQEPPRKTLLMKIVFLPYAAVFLSILTFWDVAQKLLILLGGKRFHHYTAYWFNASVRYSLWLLGTRISVVGMENAADLPADKPYVIVCNHQSMFDIPILYTCFHKHWPRFIAKIELSRWIPGLSVCLRSDGSALIDRKNPRQAVPEIKRLGQLMSEQGFGVVMFPEGTRTKTGAIKEFHKTGMISLLNAAPEAVVIPAAIDGSWKLQYYRKGPAPLGVKIKVRVGKPIFRDSGEPREIVTQAETAVQELLIQIRS